LVEVILRLKRETKCPNQVLGLGAEEAALAYLASQTGPNKAFKNKIETMKHLLKRSLLPLFEGFTNCQ
jgi:hypothetical protein